MALDRRTFAEARFQHAFAASRFDHARTARMRALLADSTDGRLLDVGCYDGQVARSVAPASARIVGVDLSLPALRAARDRGIAVARAQVEGGLPFADASFPTIVAAEVIEHVFDTEAFLAELRRLLEPRGRLLLTTPNLVALSGRAKLLLGKSPANVEYDASPGTSGHIRYFTFDTLEALMRRVGLAPLGRWTNVVHLSTLGSSERLGSWLPGLGHTLISLATRP